MKAAVLVLVLATARASARVRAAAAVKGPLEGERVRALANFTPTEPASTRLLKGAPAGAMSGAPLSPRGTGPGRGLSIENLGQVALDLAPATPTDRPRADVCTPAADRRLPPLARGGALHAEWLERAQALVHDGMPLGEALAWSGAELGLIREEVLDSTRHTAQGWVKTPPRSMRGGGLAG